MLSETEIGCRETRTYHKKSIPDGRLLLFIDVPKFLTFLVSICDS